MAQPFRPRILEGEYSLFYFDRVYSHAISKVPVGGEFRVQEEHGGTISAIEPSSELRTAAEVVLAAVDGDLLYARVDLVAGPVGFELMELELIEPSLYLRMDSGAPARFAEAIARRR